MTESGMQGPGKPAEDRPEESSAEPSKLPDQPYVDVQDGDGIPDTDAGKIPGFVAQDDEDDGTPENQLGKITKAGALPPPADSGTGQRRLSGPPPPKKPGKITKAKVNVSLELSLEEDDEETEEYPDPEPPRR
jgi:hypothetical protein